MSLDNLHKKCLLTTNKNFDVRHVWHYDDSYISLYSKNKGKAGTENKFELPPPLDNELYFGTVGFFKHRSEELNIDEIENFEMEDFKKMIDYLFGGFENLDDTSEGTSEEEVIPEEFKTKRRVFKRGRIYC